MVRPCISGSRLRGRLRRVGTVTALVLSTQGVPLRASASEVRIRSRTLGEGYMVRVPGPQGQLLSRRRVVQYVNLGAYQLLPPTRPDRFRRDDDEAQLELVTSLRIRHDFGTYAADATAPAASLVDAVDTRQIDLLFGYLQGRNLGGWVDTRIGRQYEMSGLDWYAFDGGYVRIRTPAHFAVETFGGFAVDGSAMFGYPDHELDGTARDRSDGAVSPMIGAALSLADLSWADARFAYRRTFTPASVNPDAIDPDGTGLSPGVDQEIVSGSFALRLAKGRVSPYVATRYSLGTARLDDLTVGASWAITPLHSVRAVYLRTIPTFDLDSIFNVFAVEPFEDMRVVYQVRPGPAWTLAARGQVRVFHDATTGVHGTDPRRDRPVGAGGGASATYRRPRFSMRLDAFGLGGEGGLRTGGSVDTRTLLAWDRIALDARIYGVYYDDDLVSARTGWALSLQGGTNIRLWEGIHINLVAEEMVTRFASQSFRLLGIFSVDWSLRAGQR